MSNKCECGRNEYMKSMWWPGVDCKCRVVGFVCCREPGEERVPASKYELNKLKWKYKVESEGEVLITLSDNKRPILFNSTPPTYLRI